MSTFAAQPSVGHFRILIYISTIIILAINLYPHKEDEYYLDNYLLNDLFNASDTIYNVRQIRCILFYTDEDNSLLMTNKDSDMYGFYTHERISYVTNQYMFFIYFWYENYASISKSNITKYVFINIKGNEIYTTLSLDKVVNKLTYIKKNESIYICTNILNNECNDVSADAHKENDINSVKYVCKKYNILYSDTSYSLQYIKCSFHKAVLTMPTNQDISTRTYQGQYSNIMRINTNSIRREK